MNLILEKKIKYYTKEAFRLFSLLVFGVLLIILAIFIKFKPVYKVTFLGQEIGKVNNKDEIETAIKEYAENPTGDIAFITIKDMPEYEFKLVDVNEKTNEEEILLAVQDTAIITYKRYAITLGGVQKAVVSTMDEAKEVVDQIKSEFNKDLELNIAVQEVYDSNNIELESVDTAVGMLNSDEFIKEKLKEQRATVNGVTLHLPISEKTSTVITSRFGSRGGGYHTGLDIATSTGTPIHAVADGKVIQAGWQGSYGNLVIIDHGNGVQTYYAHCSSIYVSVGDTVETGDTIAAVGSTGNSTGPHLHLEVRVNGEIKNPQNYLYN